MIEAVNSSIASAQLLRGSVEQVSTAPQNVAPPVTVGEAPAAPKAPYISPYISVDLNSNKAVLQIRDSETGDVEQQFPTESRLAQLQQQEARQEAASRVARANSYEVQNTQLSSDSVSTVGQTTDIVTVQDVTSSEPSNNVSLPSPQVAAAALDAGAQSAQNAASAGISVLA